MNVRRVIAILLSCGYLGIHTGCHTAPTPPSMPAEIKLHYDLSLARIGFPSPLLRGSVRGESAWFIIDTGAGVHTLASWFVGATHMSTHTANATVQGSTGVESSLQTVYGEAIHGEGGNAEIRLREAIVVDFPPVFKEHRIAGLLSPQLLAPQNMAAILDLRDPRLSFGPPPPASAGTRVCHNPASLFPNRLYAGPISMGNVETLMLVDTGATSSVAAPSSPVAAALAGRASETGHLQGVGGTAKLTRKVPGVALEFGGSGTTVALVIGASASTCGAGGLLGMDALRGCRLVLGESAFSWSCRPRP